MLCRKRNLRKNTTKGWFPKEAPHATEDVGPSSQATEDVGPSSQPMKYVGPSPSTPPRPKKLFASWHILAYNKNILAVMTPNVNGFEFSIFDFIWEEINAISENPLKSCGYAPYIMHITERVTVRTCYCEKEHHPLRIKNDLKAPVEDRRVAVGQLVSSTHRAARRSGQQGDKPPSPIQTKISLLFGICKFQHATEVKAQHERRTRRKDIKSVKEIHSHLNLQPSHSPIASKGEESPKIESFEERIAYFDVETPVQQWYGDASFNDFSFNYGGMVGTSSSHPPPFDSSPPAHTQDDEGEESGEQDEDDEWSL
jgi:hypothetical protein